MELLWVWDETRNYDPVVRLCNALSASLRSIIRKQKKIFDNQPELDTCPVHYGDALYKLTASPGSSLSNNCIGPHQFFYIYQFDAYKHS